MALDRHLGIGHRLGGSHNWVAYSPHSYCTPKACKGRCWIEALHRASMMLFGKGLAGEPDLIASVYSQPSTRWFRAQLWLAP